MEPASEPMAIDGSGQAEVPAGCARAQCTSKRWLPGDVVEGTCKLAPAGISTSSTTAAAKGEFAVRLEAKGGRGTPIDATIKLSEGAPRAPLALPPVAPGGYLLSIHRAGSPWTCSSEPLSRQPVKMRVSVPWRDAVLQKGQLKNARGEPLLQVPVQTYRYTSMLSPSGDWACAVAPAAPVSSSAGGAFEVPVDSEVETLIVAGGWDHPKGIAVRSRRGAIVDPMNLVLKPAYRLEAKVLDDKDIAVACRTEIMTTDVLDNLVASTVPGSVRKGTCAPDGRIRLGPLLSPSYELAVFPDEALPARRRGTADRPVTDLGVIRVDRGASIEVEVRSVEGKVVSGADVSASNRDGEIVQRTARTPATGLVTLKGLPRSTPIDIRVRARDYATYEKPGIQADGARVEIVLARGGNLRGKVRTPDGAVPRWATISWNTEASKTPSIVPTAEDGTFVIDPPPGPVEVHASAPGFASSETARVEVPPERAPPDLELTLRERDLLRGRVVDPDGRPMPGASVLLLFGGSLGDPPEIGTTASAVSGADGEFTLPEPESGQVVVALRRGYAPGRAEYASGMDGGIELRLGRPAAVRVKLPDAFSENGRMEVRDGEGMRRGVYARSRTDILVEDLWPTNVEVLLMNGPEKRVRVAAGETAVVDFRSVGTVHGRVMHKGRAIARAAVLSIQRTPGGERIAGTTLTDDDGRFEMASVDAGAQRFLAQAAEGRADRQVTIPEGAEVNVDLELSDARLDVLVTDAKTGAPVHGAKLAGKIAGAACWGTGYVRLSGEQGGYFISYTQAGCLEGASAVDGTSSIAVPTPGAYDVSVRAADYEPWTAKMNLGHDIVPVRVELARGSLPRVRVILESDPPGVDGMFYCVQGVKRTEKPAKGEGLCEGLDPGTAFVSFRAPGYGFARTAVTVPERGDAEVRLKVPRGGDLVIPVDSKDAGIGVIDAQGIVMNMWSGMGYPECDYTADAEGKLSFVCRVLPPGTYKVTTRAGIRGNFEVRPGETTVAY